MVRRAVRKANIANRQSHWKAAVGGTMVLIQSRASQRVQRDVRTICQLCLGYHLHQLCGGQLTLQLVGYHLRKCQRCHRGPFLRIRQQKDKIHLLCARNKVLRNFPRQIQNLQPQSLHLLFQMYQQLQNQVRRILHMLQPHHGRPGILHLPLMHQQAQVPERCRRHRDPRLLPHLQDQLFHHLICWYGDHLSLPHKQVTTYLLRLMLALLRVMRRPDQDILSSSLPMVLHLQLG
mmetsp:Transcript_22749/g.45698  ORF Transcript_22749/g.45698 Transcript_22749/m.45698 type:complete len:234 (+) Transcript_22749:162-863(+)